jgi:Mn-dependent DtxR family transcriptional regulator
MEVDYFGDQPKGTQRRRVMPTSEEQQLLQLLAKEWKHSGPPGIMDISDIIAALGQAPSATMQALKSLYQIGMVDMNTLKTSAFLTPEGHSAAYEDAELRSTNKDKNI